MNMFTGLARMGGKGLCAQTMFSEAVSSSAIVGFSPSHARFLFCRCAIGTPDRVWFVVQDDPVFRMLQLKDGKWIQTSVSWQAVGICGVASPTVETYMIGADGEVLRGQKTGFSEEHVDAKKNRPNSLGIIRDAKLIDGCVFAAGMGRQVYQRDPEGHWQCISESILSSDSPPVGFNSIAGWSTDDLIAVGFGGEIWRYQSGRWSQLSSPTSVALHSVQPAGKNRAYACGQLGTLLEIDGDKVRQVQHKGTQENLFGLTYFRDSLYVASLKSIYVLANDQLKAVGDAPEEHLTTGHLSSDNVSIWSVGAHHLQSSTDGNKWSAVRCTL
jgi:hypothetical protein